MNLNESIINIRVKLQELNLRKSGRNSFAKFDYFELSDFLPSLNKLMLEEKVNDIFTIRDNLATLTLIKESEKQEYSMPFQMFSTPPKMQEIQYLGALNTYYKRYLYLNAFGITDGDVVDALDNTVLTNNVNHCDKINTLIADTNTDLSVFLAHFKVKSVSDLTQQQCETAVKQLQTKLKKVS